MQSQVTTVRSWKWIHSDDDGGIEAPFPGQKSSQRPLTEIPDAGWGPSWLVAVSESLAAVF